MSPTIGFIQLHQPFIFFKSFRMATRPHLLRVSRSDLTKVTRVVQLGDIGGVGELGVIGCSTEVEQSLCDGSVMQASCLSTSILR